MYLIIFLEFLSPSSFIPPQNVVYFLMLPFLVHKIFTLYINGVLNCKYPASGPRGWSSPPYLRDKNSTQAPQSHCRKSNKDFVTKLYSHFATWSGNQNVVFIKRNHGSQDILVGIVPRLRAVRFTVRFPAGTYRPALGSTHLPIHWVTSKAIPLQTWTGPKGSRSLRLPDLKTFDTWMC